MILGYFLPSKLSFGRLRHLILGSSISTGSKRRSVSAYNGSKWADLRAPGWEMALWLPPFKPLPGNQHTEGTLTLLSLMASLPWPLLACERAGRFQLPERNEGNTKRKLLLFFFFIAIVLMVLSHGFCRCIFLLKTRVVCVFLTSCQPENPLGGQLHLSLSTRLGNGKKKTQFHSSIQILIIRWLKRITFICQLSAIAVLEVLCC